MSSESMVALLSLAGTLLGTFGGIITSSKLSNYRIEQLEKKVQAHNNLVEFQLTRPLRGATRGIL